MTYMLMTGQILQISAILALVLLVAIALVGLSNDRFFFEESLPQEGPISEDVTDDVAEYVVTFRDGDVSSIVTIMTSTIHDVPDRYDIRLRIYQPDDTRIDRVFLTFETVDASMQLALKRPVGHQWEPIRFHLTGDAQSTIVEVDDLGTQQDVTVQLEFALGPIPDVEPIPEMFPLEMGIWLHENRTLTFTRHRAEARVEVALPGTSP